MRFSCTMVTMKLPSATLYSLLDIATNHRLGISKQSSNDVNIGTKTFKLSMELICQIHFCLWLQTILKLGFLVEDTKKKKPLHKKLFELTSKYGVPINQWAWLYQALLEVSMNKIALWINACADDWIVERTIIVSNSTDCFMCYFLQFLLSLGFHVHTSGYSVVLLQQHEHEQWKTKRMERMNIL